MFKKIKGFKNSNGKLIYVDKRFEFFHNYWTTFKPKDSLIFFHEERFESHRSIIKKIEDQLKYNFDNSYDKFFYLFIDNHLFQQSNTFANKLSIRRRYQNILSIIDPNGSTSNKEKKRNYLQNKDRIEKEIKSIKSILLQREPYDLQIAKKLLKIISTNKPLSENEKNTFKFLINSFIVELFYYGYELDFILKVPEILIFNQNLHDFPFQKVRSDFRNKSEYEKYIQAEKESMNLAKMLEGLLNLVRRESKVGYYVFKVDNIILHNPHPITIGESTFYNPQLKRYINLKGENELYKKRYMDVENFYFPDKDEVLEESRLSKCNVIIKSRFKASKNIESPSELYRAYEEVCKSLSILNHLMNRYSRGNEGKGKIQFHKHFRLRDNKKVSGYSLGIFWNQIKKIEVENTNKELEYFNMELDFINTIDQESELGRKLFTVISTHYELESQRENFNFKDLWIAWEAIAERNKIIELAQNCYRVMFKKNFISKVKIFLSHKLEKNYFSPDSEYYTISKEKIREIGLNVPYHKEIPERKFKNNYKKLEDLVPTYFMQDFITRIDLFLNNRNYLPPSILRGNY